MRPAILSSVALLLAGVVGGCATYSQYRCPDPIGEIVRQDCDDYKMRYESMQASLQVSFGSLSIGGSMGQERLRDPSELIQVMVHQMLALCHDYNACRVPSTDFSRRREQMDRTFTAVMAILDQLKRSGLSDGERQSLLRELITILKGPAPVAPAGVAKTPAAEPSKPAPPVFTRNPFRRNTGWWLASKQLPPQPPPTPDLPVLIGLKVHESRRQPMKGFTVYLWGKIPEDDDLWAEGPAGVRMPCKLSRKRDQPLASASCRPKRGTQMPQQDSFKLSYTIGAKAQTVALGEVDLRDQLRVHHGWLAFQPEPITQEPVLRERPYLVMFSAARANQTVGARCWHDGKPLRSGGSAVLKGSRHTNPYIRVQTYVIPLPFVVDYGDLRAQPAQDPPLSAAAGPWRCVLKLGADALREVRFQVTPAGAIEAHPKQRGQAGQLASPWWLLETRVLPNPQEH